MSDKKEKILETALELFAREGYNSTPTSKIAQKAEVSEGLIFRHFENKKGLLDAIMKNAEEKAAVLFAHIIEQNEAKQTIRKTIELPFTIDQLEYDFWKLQFKLKWDQEYNNPQKMQPLLDKLTWAFSELNYENPSLEAQLLNQTLESVSSEILKGNLHNQEQYKAFLINKYQV